MLAFFFFSLALLLSQVLPTRSAASGVAIGLLLASYVLKVLLELDDSLAAWRYSPRCTTSRAACHRGVNSYG